MMGVNMRCLIIVLFLLSFGPISMANWVHTFFCKGGTIVWVPNGEITKPTIYEDIGFFEFSVNKDEVIFPDSNESKHFKDIVLTLKVHLTDEVFHAVREDPNLVYFDEEGNQLNGVLNLGSMHYGQGAPYYTVNNGIYAGKFTIKCVKK